MAERRNIIHAMLASAASMLGYNPAVLDSMTRGKSFRSRNGNRRSGVPAARRAARKRRNIRRRLPK